MKKILIIIMYIVGFLTDINAQSIPVTTTSEEARSFYKNGWQLEDKLELDEAEKMYRKAVDTDSTFALAYLRLAMIKDNYDVRRKELKVAEKYIDKVTEAEKLWIKGRIDFYALGYDGSKEYGYFKRLVELYPDDAMANYLFGFVNVHHGGHKPQLAISHFEKAIKLNPNFIRPYNELAYGYIEIRDFESAKKVTKKYIELLPTSVNPLDTYAETLMRNGEYQKSIEIYRKVLRIDPEFPWALIGIAANMNFLKRNEEGRNYVKRLNEEKLSDYEYRHKWRALVTSYLDEGNFKDALGILEEQKQASIKGINKREPKFHIYYAFLRKTKLYFENNQPDEGYKEYESWKAYVDKNFKSEKAKERLKNLEMYYESYRSFIKNDISRAKRELLSFQKINGKETDNSKILLSKIFLKEKRFEDAKNKLKETDLNDSYNQYWLMIALTNKGDFEKAKKWKFQIINFNDRNNINLALVRRKTLAHKILNE